MADKLTGAKSRTQTSYSKPTPSDQKNHKLGHETYRFSFPDPYPPLSEIPPACTNDVGAAEGYTTEPSPIDETLPLGRLDAVVEGLPRSLSQVLHRPSGPPWQEATKRARAAEKKKTESALATQIQTENIGRADFLHRQKVPGVPSPACPCGWRGQTPKRLLSGRELMLLDASTNNYRLLTKSSKSLISLTAWLDEIRPAGPLLAGGTGAVSKIASFFLFSAVSLS